MMMMTKKEPIIKLEMALPAIEMILFALRKMPMEQVEPLVASVRAVANEQIKQHNEQEQALEKLSKILATPEDCSAAN